jgi:hypothetical protein
MSPMATNPYPKDAPEHGQWDRWHQLFFAQPIARQLVELHAHLRGDLDHFRSMSSELGPPAVHERFCLGLEDLEGAVNLLEEIADHAASLPTTKPDRSTGSTG